MSNLMKNLVAMSLVMGMAMVQDTKGVHPSEDKHIERPKGKEHRVRSEEEKASKKAHKKSIKARRNARNGVYKTKITYKKARKQ